MESINKVIRRERLNSQLGATEPKQKAKSYEALRQLLRRFYFVSDEVWSGGEAMLVSLFAYTFAFKLREKVGNARASWNMKNNSCIRVCQLANDIRILINFTSYK